jgi:hypothetical protein
MPTYAAYVFNSHDAVMDMSATFQTSPLSLFSSLYLFYSRPFLPLVSFFFFRNVINSGFPVSRKLRNGNQFFPSLTRERERERRRERESGEGGGNT